MKKVWLLGLILVLVFGMLCTAQNVPNPDTLVYVTFAGWDSFDPAWCYDTASGEALFHIYETLIGYVGASTSEFRPVLATEVPSIENSGIAIAEDGSATVRFHIRDGVTFHHGGVMSAEDVVYSFHRNLLADPVAGPNWMLLYQLLGVFTLDDIINSEGGADAAYQAVMDAVYIPEDDPNAVEFKLPMMTPYFLNTLSDNCSWSTIVDKSWSIEQGAWNGTPDNWLAWHDLPKEEMALYNIANGTGPFMLEGTPDPVEGYTLVRYGDYWDKENLPKLQRVEVIYDEEWTNRRLMLANGDADIASIPIQYKSQVEGTPGVRTIYNLPTGSNGGFLLNMDIVTEGNDRLGSGKLDGAGIPPDFFTDVHVRKAFSYIFDYDTYIDQVMMGEATQPVGVIPPAVPYYNPDQEKYTYDLDKALEEFKLAWDGEVWKNGFYMRLDYNAGNEGRKTGCEMIRDALMKIDVRFNVEVRGIPWANYLDDNRARRMTMFFIGWLWDYPDADNYVVPYLHSTGTYGGRGSFDALGELSDQLDALIEAGSATLDPAERKDIYYEIQQLAYENALNIMTYEGTARRWMRTWVGGFGYNPTWSNNNFKTLYKEANATLHPMVEEFDYKLEEW
jgi:peptide/nickel transport system substrate-binding protein